MNRCQLTFHWELLSVVYEIGIAIVIGIDINQTLDPDSDLDSCFMVGCHAYNESSPFVVKALAD